MERIEAVMARRPVSEPARPRIPERFDVEFRDVSFSYEAEGPENASALSTRAQALSSVSFHAEEGRVTALVGPSGGGKSICVLIGSQLSHHISTRSPTRIRGKILAETKK